MSVSTLMASVMIVAMQAQAQLPPQSSLPPGAAVGPMSSASPNVLFRWTDFKGQINYGDRPPPDAQNVIRIDLMTRTRSRCCPIWSGVPRATFR